MKHDIDLASAGEAHAGRPHAMRPANRNRQNWHAGFNCYSHRSRFELDHRAIRPATATFRENHNCATLAQPLERSTYRRRVSPFHLERPGPEEPDGWPNYRPTKSCVPGQVTQRPLDRVRDPQ